MSSKIKVAVLGVGSLGKEHARVYAELAKNQSVDFKGVFDVNLDAARKIAAKYQVTAFKSLDGAASASEALSVVTPTEAVV